MVYFYDICILFGLLIIYIQLYKMVKKLVLVRHAKSDWSDVSVKDFDRALNNQGYQDAPRIGNRLNKMGILPDVIFSSSALRTRMTAEFICEQIAYDLNKVIFDDELYETSVRTLLNYINQLDDKYNTVMMFGHNPTYTYIAEALSGQAIGNVPTCGALSLTFEINSWAEVSAGTAKLDWFIYPKDGQMTFHEEVK